MRETWEAPSIAVEQFAANDYVAACWGVGCDWSKANEYEKDHHYYDNGNVSHNQGQCGDHGNQVIFDDNNDGIADRMVEVKTSGLGDLLCTIFEDANYSTIKNIGSVKKGDYIYWTTTSGDRTWHHQGSVFETVPNHPNRSM